MEFELTTSVVIGTNCTDSCKSNYHTIMTTMAPTNFDIMSSKLYITFVLIKRYLFNLTKFVFSITLSKDACSNKLGLSKCSES